MFIDYIAESIGLSLLTVFIVYWIIERITRKPRNNNMHVVAVFVSVVLSFSILISILDIKEYRILKIIIPAMMTVIYYFIYNFKGAIVKLIAVIIVPLILHSSNSDADMFRPSHMCFKPTNPFSITSQFDIDIHNSNIRGYKLCIEEFIDKQNEAVDQHRKAIKDAIEEWNDFVSYNR